MSRRRTEYPSRCTPAKGELLRAFTRGCSFHNINNPLIFKPVLVFIHAAWAYRTRSVRFVTMESSTRSSARSFEPGPVVNPRVLWQKRGQLVSFVGLSLVAGVLYLALAPRSYQVHARLLIESRGEVLPTGRTEAKERDFLPTQAEIIRSPAVIEQALDRMDLASLRELGLAPGLSPGWLDWGLSSWRRWAGSETAGGATPSANEAALHEVHKPDLTPAMVGALPMRAAQREMSPFDGSSARVEEQGAAATANARKSTLLGGETGRSTEEEASSSEVAFVQPRAVGAPQAPAESVAAAVSRPRADSAENRSAGAQAAIPVELRAWAAGEVLEDLEVQPLAGTSVLSLQFTARDDQKAIDMMQAVIASYRQFLQQQDQSAHRETMVVLAEREKGLRDDLKRLQSEYETLHRESPLLGRDSTAAETQRAALTRLGELLSTTKQRRIQLENYRMELAGLQNRAPANEALVEGFPSLEGPTTLIRMPRAEPTTGVSQGTVREPAIASGEPNRAALSERVESEERAAADLLSRMSREGIVSFEDPLLLQRSLSEALVREAELGQKFGPKHPDMRAVRGLIQSLRDRLTQTVRDAPAMVERELVAVREHEERLGKAYQEEFQRMKEVDHVLLQEEQVLAEIQRVQTVHATLMTQLNQSELSDEAAAGGRATIGVRVLDGPAIDTTKTWPKPVPLMAICVVMGLCGGVLFVSAGQRWEQQGPTHA